MRYANGRPTVYAMATVPLLILMAVRSASAQDVRNLVNDIVLGTSLPSHKGKVDTAFAKSMVRGETTKETVKANLGEPLATVQSSEVEEWTYAECFTKSAAKAILFGDHKKVLRLLKIQFQGGKVSSYSLMTDQNSKCG